MKANRHGSSPRPELSRSFVVALLILAGIASGCSSFNRDWKAAESAPGATDELAGRWQGTWLSDVNGHTEQLRCLMTKQGETNYVARFQAKYRKVVRITVGYTVPLMVETRADGSHFKGEADLGWLSGGVYRYQGHSNQTNFFSTYECQYDHGTFRMTRPAAGQ